MKNNRFVFEPHMAMSLSDEEVKINGHKVLFDKKVSLMPVDIRKINRNKDGKIIIR
jgi:hypothetical protein